MQWCFVCNSQYHGLVQGGALAPATGGSCMQGLLPASLPAAGGSERRELIAIRLVFIHRKCSKTWRSSDNSNEETIPFIIFQCSYDNLSKNIYISAPAPLVTTPAHAGCAHAPQKLAREAVLSPIFQCACKASARTTI
jgi:hypothetical protein